MGPSLLPMRPRCRTAIVNTWLTSVSNRTAISLRLSQGFQFVPTGQCWVHSLQTLNAVSNLKRQEIARCDKEHHTAFYRVHAYNPLTVSVRQWPDKPTQLIPLTGSTARLIVKRFTRNRLNWAKYASWYCKVKEVVSKTVHMRSEMLI